MNYIIFYFISKADDPSIGQGKKDSKVIGAQRYFILVKIDNCLVQMLDEGAWNTNYKLESDQFTPMSFILDLQFYGVQSLILEDWPNHREYTYVD